MSKERFINLELIKNFIKKNKSNESKIKSDILSINIVFAFLFIIGFMFMIIYFKYIEKKRVSNIEKSTEEQEKKKIEEEKKKRELEILSPTFQSQKTFHNQQIRNTVVQTKDTQVREKKENELRKKFIVDLSK
jgi:predicted membrane protein